VANSVAGTIGKYTTSGSVVNASLVSGLDAPHGVAVSGSDLYFVSTVSSTHTVGEYDAGTGAAIDATLISGLTDQNGGLAISPIPEAGTYAAILGFAALGYAMIRRRGGSSTLRLA